MKTIETNCTLYRLNDYRDPETDEWQFEVKEVQARETARCYFIPLDWRGSERVDKVNNGGIYHRSAEQAIRNGIIGVRGLVEHRFAEIERLRSQIARLEAKDAALHEFAAGQGVDPDAPSAAESDEDEDRAARASKETTP